MDDLEGFDNDILADEEEENFEEEISQEDAWSVITKFFDEKGLVSQQIDSFDEFVNNTIQEIVSDSGEIAVTPANQYVHGQDIQQVRLHKMQFLSNFSVSLCIFL